MIFILLDKFAPETTTQNCLLHENSPSVVCSIVILGCGSTHLIPNNKHLSAFMCNKFFASCYNLQIKINFLALSIRVKQFTGNNKFSGSDTSRYCGISFGSSYLFIGAFVRITFCCSRQLTQFLQFPQFRYYLQHGKRRCFCGGWSNNLLGH